MRTNIATFLIVLGPLTILSLASMLREGSGVLFWTWAAVMAVCALGIGIASALYLRGQASRVARPLGGLSMGLLALASTCFIVISGVA